MKAQSSTATQVGSHITALTEETLESTASVKKTVSKATLL